MAAPIPIKSYCVLLFENFFSCYETQQLILGTGTAIWWVTEPHWFILQINCNDNISVEGFNVTSNSNQSFADASSSNIIKLPLKMLNSFQYLWVRQEPTQIDVSCKISEHFALQVDPVIGFIQLGSTPFKVSPILVPKLADPPLWWKSNYTHYKSGSGLPDPDWLIFCTI